MNLRDQLVNLAIKWQQQFGVAPAITSAISEYDATMFIGMSEENYFLYMQDKTAVMREHDFIYEG